MLIYKNKSISGGAAVAGLSKEDTFSKAAKESIEVLEKRDQS